MPAIGALYFDTVADAQRYLANAPPTAELYANRVRAMRRIHIPVTTPEELRANRAYLALHPNNSQHEVIVCPRSEQSKSGSKRSKPQSAQRKATRKEPSKTDSKRSKRGQT